MRDAVLPLADGVGAHLAVRRVAGAQVVEPKHQHAERGQLIAQQAQTAQRVGVILAQRAADQDRAAHLLVGGQMRNAEQR